MKFSCIKCGKFVCDLDMRRTENKEEALTMSYCRDCVSKNLEYARSLFERLKRKSKFWKRIFGYKAVKERKV